MKISEIEKFKERHGHTMTNNIDLILENQRKFFRSGETLSVEFRVEMLKKLYDTIKENKSEIANALGQDLGKSEFESFMCETGMVLSEITYMIKNTAKFAAKKRWQHLLRNFLRRAIRWRFLTATCWS